MRAPNSFRKAKCKRNQRGGGSIGFSPSSVPPHIINNPLAVIAGSSCDATARSLINPFSLGPGGLPGMRGGKRRASRRVKKQKGQKGAYAPQKGAYAPQKGGGYGFDARLASEVMGGSPGLGNYAPVSHLNTGCSPVSMPPSGASGIFNQPVSGPGGLLGQRGGAYLGESNASLTVPTAGYSFRLDSPIVSSGALAAPVQEYSARAYSPSCTQMGGTRIKRKTRKQKKSRKSKKTRKSNKSRKH